LTPQRTRYLALAVASATAAVSWLSGSPNSQATAALRPKPTPTATATTTSTSAATAPTDTNLLTGDTATLSASTGAWRTNQGGLGLATSGVLRQTNAQDAWTWLQTGTPTSGTSATPGATYRGSFDVRAVQAGRKIVPSLTFWANDGSILAKVAGQALTSSTSAWSTTRSVVGIAPPNTVRVTLGMFVANGLTGESQDLTRPFLSSSLASRTNVVGPLRTSGSTLYDANGPITLRGIHYLGFEQATGWERITWNRLVQAKRWGANAVRLSLASPYWQTDACQAKAGYVGAVDDAVRNITGLGMVAILDLHESATKCGGAVEPQKMPDSSTVVFWRDVASRYKSNPLVAFDLYNEPHDVPDGIWLNGGTVRISLTSTYQSPGMQGLYDTVRSAGASNLVIVSGNGWASYLPSQVLSSTTNLVYGAHAYTCPTSTTQSTCSQSNPTDPSSILGAWATRTNLPIMVSEWGWPDSEDGRYATNVVAFAQAHGWGWMAFAMDGWTNGTFSLVQQVSDVTGDQPSPAGMPVLDALSRS
jgi:hypothetical protein